MLNVAEFLFPNTSKLWTLQHVFVYKVYQFYTCRSRYEGFALLPYVMAFEECFYDSCTGRRTTNAVLLHCVSQFVIIHEFTCRFHCTKQGRLCVRLWRLCPFLGKGRYVWTFLALRECHVWRCIVLFFILIVRIYNRIIFLENDLPTFIRDNTYRGSEEHAVLIIKCLCSCFLDFSLLCKCHSSENSGRFKL